MILHNLRNPDMHKFKSYYPRAIDLISFQCKILHWSWFRISNILYLLSAVKRKKNNAERKENPMLYKGKVAKVAIGRKKILVGCIDRAKALGGTHAKKSSAWLHNIQTVPKSVSKQCQMETFRRERFGKMEMEICLLTFHNTTGYTNVDC